MILILVIGIPLFLIVFFGIVTYLERRSADRSDLEAENKDA